MKCPDCDLPLLTIEVGDVELDYCVQGHGTWFDEGEIEAFLDTNGPALRYSHGHAGKRRCPRCEQKLNIVDVNNAVELDLCSTGCGLWFDKGEIAGLAKALHGEDSLSELETVFAKLATQLGETA